MTRSEQDVVDMLTVEASVLSDRAQMLCNGLSLLTMNVVNAGIVAYVLGGFYPGWVVGLWLVMFIVVVAARVLDALRFRRSEPSCESARAFTRRFALGATLTGCLWGAAASSIWLTPDPAYHAFVVFVVGGMAAGAITTNASYLPAMFGFVAPAILPPIVALLARGEPTSIAMGALLSAFAIFLSVLGVRANGWVDSIARRRRAQETLAAALNHSNTLLHAISTAATELTKASPNASTIPRLLKAVGEAVGVDRIPVFETRATQGRPLVLSLLYLWQSETASAGFDVEALTARIARSGIEADELFAGVSDGRPTTIVVRTLADGPVKRFYESTGVLSVLLVPINVDETIWGLIGLEDCRTERTWTAAEIDALRILGDVIGGSIVRQRYVDQLRDANEVVERSSTILFRLRMDAPSGLVYVSRNVRRLGYESSAMLGTARPLWSRVHPEDRGRVRAALKQAMSAHGQAGMVEFRFRRGDGRYRWLDARYSPAHAGGPALLEGVALDVTERKEAAEKIALLAKTDALTELANRRAFIEALERIFAAAARGGEGFSLLYIDVDHFKSVNDTMGHASGDALLVMLAGRLRANCRASDVVARLGGDEFAVLQTQIRDRTDAVTMASKLRAVLSAPYALPRGESRATVSVGVAIYSPEVSGPDVILAQADQALYCAKAKGRDQYLFYADAAPPLASDFTAQIQPNA
jgi:diguanylate cyclase (GGDEF)-like protein/PAS domain S-box-containing protein